MATLHAPHQSSGFAPFMKIEDPLDAFMQATDAEFATAEIILSYIEKYRLMASPFEPSIVYKTRDRFLPLIVGKVQKQLAVSLVLPAFPFKSPNTTAKVLGVLPDKAEEVSLALLQGLCDGIRDVYKPGAELTIVSDGIVYNDLLGVSDLTVWNYGEALRRMAAKHGLTSLYFARISQMGKLSSVPESLTRDLDGLKYQLLAPLARDELVSTFADKSYLVDREIRTDVNVKATYLGYVKFLCKDLANQERDSSASLSSSSSSSSLTSSAGEFNGSRRSLKKHAQRIAKQMLLRGKCFAKLIQDSWPDAVRLSIHASKTPDKISIGILPNLEDNRPMTPWHSMVVTLRDGSFVPTTRSNLAKWKEPLEPVYKDYCLYCYRETTPLYDWKPLKVSFDQLYPCGLRVTAMRPDTPYSSVPMEKLRGLAENTSPVILRGFVGANNEEVFTSKAREMGPITPWIFGEILKVVDSGDSSLNNVQSAESMPMHFDGNFKVKDGKPQPPQFQIFVAVTASPKRTGRTLFAPSRLIFKYLPAPYTLDMLKALTWSVSTTAFGGTTLSGLPLIQYHPSTMEPSLRYHEDWAQERTKFDPTTVAIEGVSKGVDIGVRTALETTLYDRRVCAYVEWEDGDLLISDNIAMLHTREAFVSTFGRELWRLHVG